MGSGFPEAAVSAELDQMQKLEKIVRRINSKWFKHSERCCKKAKMHKTRHQITRTFFRQDIFVKGSWKISSSSLNQNGTESGARRKGFGSEFEAISRKILSAVKKIPVATNLEVFSIFRFCSISETLTHVLAALIIMRKIWDHLFMIMISIRSWL